MFFFDSQYRQLLTDIEINIINDSNSDSKKIIEKINKKSLYKHYYSCEDELLKLLLLDYVKRKSNKIIEIKNYIIDKLLYYKKKNKIIIIISSIIFAIVLILSVTLIFNSKFFSHNVSKQYST